MPNETMTFGPLVATLWLAVVAVGCRSEPVERRPLLEVSTDQLVTFEDDRLLYRIRDINTDDAGNIWALSGVEPFIYVYHDGSDSVAEFGQQGGGPSEFGTPWSIVRGNQDGVTAIWDAGRRRVVYVAAGPSGPTVLSARPVTIRSAAVRKDLELTSYGTPLRMARAGSYVVLQPAPRPIMNTGDLQRIVLLASVDTSRNFSDTLYVIPVREDGRRAKFLVPIPLWTTCSNGSVVILEPPNRLLTARPGSESRDTVILSWLERADIEDQDIRAFMRHSIAVEMTGRASPPEAAIRAKIDEVLRGGRYLFGTEAPVATGLLCAPDAKVWIRLFSTESSPLGLASDWIVMDGAEPVTTVRFPPGFRPMRITPAGVLGALRDEHDVERPALFHSSEGLQSSVGPTSGLLSSRREPGDVLKGRSDAR